MNAIDLYNLVDFQNADFEWDYAVVWEGNRCYEIRKGIRDLFDFRFMNHGTYADKEGEAPYKHEHSIQIVAKLMMNSIFGKSIIKPYTHRKAFVEKYAWEKDRETGVFKRRDNWKKFLKANMYRLKQISHLGPELIEATLYERDTSASLNIFGSNVLAMARRIIGRVMALAEEMEDKHPEMSPGVFYTDTDSMHITNELLGVMEEEYEKRYGKKLRGEELGQFHPDFDAPKVYKKGEKVIGAVESFFIAKKVYVDKLEGNQGSIGYHKRMKGVPAKTITWEDYDKIYQDIPVTFDLLSNDRTSFYYENGQVGCRRKMERVIMTKEAREQLRHDLQVVSELKRVLGAAEKRKRKEEDTDEEPVLELPPKLPREETPQGDIIILDYPPKHWEEDDATQKLPEHEEKEEEPNEDREINI